MVTRNRARLAERAIECFAAQTWPETERELVIVDDGDEDYTPLVARHRRLRIRYHRIEASPDRRLGDLRNMALDLADGDLCAQWDDDEWYHPERLERQVEELERTGALAVVLRDTLMHMDTARMVDHPYRADAGKGTPGTILHRRTWVRYPSLGRAEDSEFLRALAREAAVAVLPDRAHLFIRCFHGDNTWNERHFVRRLWRTPMGAARSAGALILAGDLRAHPAFRLGPAERAAADEFLAHSRRLGVLQH
jgi:glycosyltransferase involved in cell wall biosynthesis